MTTTREELDEQGRRLAKTISRGIPDDVGFGLLLFNYGEGGTMSWITNANPGDMVKALQELLERFESGTSDDPR